MRERKLRIGDKVKVIGVATLSISGRKDTLGTRKLLQHMLGSVYTVRGLDEYGLVELHPRRLSYVWIESELLKLRARKRK